MISRLSFLMIAGFWVTMNVLLWRSVSGTHDEIGGSVPVNVVWQKILTAPDNSSLDIFDRDKKIGFCHWMATVGGSPQLSGKRLTDEYHPEEMNQMPTNYILHFEGNTSLHGFTNRLRMEFTLRLATNQMWESFFIRASLRPTVWEMDSVAATHAITIKVNDDTGYWQKTLDFADLQNPGSLVEDFGGSQPLGLLGLMGLPMDRKSFSRLSDSIQWEAHEARLQLGHSRVRVYRLETIIMGRPVVFEISRVGEILWAELPNHITLRNDAFSAL